MEREAARRLTFGEPVIPIRTTTPGAGTPVIAPIHRSGVEVQRGQGTRPETHGGRRWDANSGLVRIQGCHCLTTRWPVRGTHTGPNRVGLEEGQRNMPQDRVEGSGRGERAHSMCRGPGGRPSLVRSRKGRTGQRGWGLGEHSRPKGGPRRAPLSRVPSLWRQASRLLGGALQTLRDPLVTTVTTTTLSAGPAPSAS